MLVFGEIGLGEEVFGMPLCMCCGKGHFGQISEDLLAIQGNFNLCQHCDEHSR